MERYTIVSFRSRLNRQMENMAMERLRSLLSAKQIDTQSFRSPCEQPICPFQKLERRWNGTTAFSYELGLRRWSPLFNCSSAGRGRSWLIVHGNCDNNSYILLLKFCWSLKPVPLSFHQEHVAFCLFGHRARCFLTSLRYILQFFIIFETLLIADYT